LQQVAQECNVALSADEVSLIKNVETYLTSNDQKNPALITEATFALFCKFYIFFFF